MKKILKSTIRTEVKAVNCLSSSNSLLLIDEEPLPSNNFTLLVTTITGVLGTVIIVVLLYCFVKKKRWLFPGFTYSNSSRTTNQQNPQLQGLCEDMQDAELAQVVKKDPEIGKTIKLYHTVTKNNTAVAGVSSMAGH